MSYRPALRYRLVLSVAVFLLTATGIFGQSSQTTSTDTPVSPNVLPRLDYRFTGQVGRTVADSDPAKFPQPVKPPANAPNIVVILLDDVGFGQFGTFGGAIPTPNLDKLAAEGLRYNRFHTTAICSPTRAALLTGRNHHVDATGGIAESATGYDGYTSIIPKRTGMFAEVLQQNGYATAWIGKNHNTPAWEINPRGPFDDWPTACASITFTALWAARPVSGNPCFGRTICWFRALPIPSIT
jgi:Sulfatase